MLTTGSSYFWSNLKAELKKVFEGNPVTITHHGPKKPYAIAQAFDLNAKQVTGTPLPIAQIKHYTPAKIRSVLKKGEAYFISDPQSFPDKVVRISGIYNAPKRASFSHRDIPQSGSSARLPHLRKF